MIFYYTCWILKRMVDCKEQYRYLSLWPKRYIFKIYIFRLTNALLRFFKICQCFFYLFKSLNLFKRLESGSEFRIPDHWIICNLNISCRLAWDNVGLIDWEAETPVLFQRFMSSFGLPVFYKKLGVALRPAVMDCNSMARWIVGSLSAGVLAHLAVMMAAINSYTHPTSQGAYSDRLVEFINKLVHCFMLRLSQER